jgi:hypothetical protein
VIAASDAPGNRGWESIAAAPDGVVAIWLDHRELAGAAAAPAMSKHQHGAGGMEHAGGAARAQLSKLYFGRLGEPGSMRPLVGGVCYCCKTALTADLSGRVYAAWRHVYDGNVRDIAFTMSSDGGRSFAPPLRVSSDHWVLDGCPENGPALAADGAGHVHIAWPTLVPAASPAAEPQMALFYATATAGGPFTPRLRLPTQDFPRHPQVTLAGDGTVVVVWDEQAKGERRIVLARQLTDDRGTVQFSREVIATDAPGVYPVVATTAAGVLVAWTSGADQTQLLYTLTK